MKKKSNPTPEDVGAIKPPPPPPPPCPSCRVIKNDKVINQKEIDEWKKEIDEWKKEINIARYCSNCFYGPQRCKRHAPTGYKISNGVDYPVWPEVGMFDWCGDWEGKDEPESTES